jgi:hypothetical protein
MPFPRINFTHIAAKLRPQKTGSVLDYAQCGQQNLPSRLLCRQGIPFIATIPPRPSVSMGTQWCRSRALSIPGSKPACYQATGEGAMARLRCHHTKTKSGRSGTPMACLTRSPTIQPTVVHETTIPRVAYSHLPSVSASG